MTQPAGVSAPRRRIGRLLRYLPALALLGILLWAGVLRLSGNLHEVDPGRVYRSAQLSPEHLQRLIAEKHLRAVINLRGHSDAPWYVAESTVTSAAGIQHIDISLSARMEPDSARLDSLRMLLRTTPTPFLVHCEAGADRSGLASALYALDELRQTPAQADRQLTWRDLHFPWIGKTGAMDRTFWRVVDARAPMTK